MARILEQLPGLEMVTVRRGPVTGQGGAEYTVVIEKFPALPVENNLWNHDGEQSMAWRSMAWRSMAWHNAAPPPPLICSVRSVRSTLTPDLNTRSVQSIRH